MPMRFKGVGKHHRKLKKQKDQSSAEASAGVIDDNGIERPAKEKRLYVKCRAMVDEQRTTDPALGRDIVYINDEHHAITIDNEHFTGQAVFRVNHFDGWTPVDADGKPRPVISDIEYFEGHRRAFSIQMSGRFKKEWTGDEVMFGTWFDGPLVLPRGYSIALAFAGQIDRSMVHDVASDKPYICSPLICAMNVVNFEPMLDKGPTETEAEAEAEAGIKCSVKGHEEHHAQGWKGACTTPAAPKNAGGAQKEVLRLPEWQWKDGVRLEENLLAQWPTWSYPPTESFYEQQSRHVMDLSDDSKAAKHRRNWFLNEARRKAFKFHPNVCYSFDFFSPYVDVNRMQLKLGLTIDASYYLNGQPLKYQARTRDGSVVFFEFEVGLH